MDEVGLGKQLQSVRQRTGLTQQELCQKADISYSTLAKIERGAIKSPSVFTIQRIATALGTSLDELMGHSVKSPALQVAEKTKSKSGVSFLYVDINGCLVRFFHEAFNRIAEDTGASADLIETTFWHYNDALCRGEMKLAEFNDILARALGGKSVDWQTYYMQAIDPITEMHELVRWASKHYKVGLLSNIMPGFIQEMIKNGALPDVTYDAVIDSSQVQAIKPEEAIYLTAQERAGVPADEILFVDDSRTNLMAAERLGWRVLWFDDFRPAESTTRIRSALEF